MAKCPNTNYLIYKYYFKHLCKISARLAKKWLGKSIFGEKCQNSVFLFFFDAKIYLQNENYLDKKSNFFVKNAIFWKRAITP